MTAGVWKRVSQGRGFGIACGLAALVGSCAWFGAPYLLQIQGPEGTSELSFRGGNATSSPFLPADRRLFGRPLPTVWLDAANVAFEPAAYAAYNGDMGNVADDDMAAHFAAYGRAERRVGRRLRLILSYEAASGWDLSVLFGGLCNQIYSHIGMLALTVELGAEAVLPDAVHRGGRGFQDNWRGGEIQPLRRPMNTLFDVDHLVAWARQRQTVLHKVEPAIKGPVIEVTVAGESICCRKPMEHLTGAIRDAVLRAAGDYIGNHPGAPMPVFRLFLRPPRLLFAVEPDRLAMPLLEEVARNLRPTPAIRALADRMVAKLGPFNGVHLRLEDDARYQDHMGGQDAVWQAYLDTMDNASFDNSTALYVASGLLTYMNLDDFGKEVGDRLINRGVCNAVLTKEDLASSAELKKGTGGLSEALALLDFVILTHARRFVGFGLSSFSWGVQEYRCLLGSSPKSTFMPAISIPPWDAMGMSGVTVLSDHSATCPDDAAAERA